MSPACVVQCAGVGAVVERVGRVLVGRALTGQERNASPGQLTDVEGSRGVTIGSGEVVFGHLVEKGVETRPPEHPHLGSWF